MMEALRGWVLRIIGTALFCACALAITPEGRPKRAVSFACGIASVIAMASIAVGMDFSSFSSYLAEYREKADAVISSSSEEVTKKTRFIIEEQCRAYILDKADEIGGVIDAAVTAEWSENGYWYPVKAKITGAISGEGKEQLARYMESELGILEENQIWSTDDEY